MCFIGYLLVIGVTLTSARHVLDADRHVVQPKVNSNYNLGDPGHSQVVERRNIEYTSDASINQNFRVDPAIVNRGVIREQVGVYSFVTESDHVAFISEKIESSNNIGNEETVFKLRTNAYPINKVEIPEHTTPFSDDYKGYKNIEQESPQRQSSRSQNLTSVNSDVQNLNKNSHHTQRNPEYDANGHNLPKNTEDKYNSNRTSQFNQGYVPANHEEVVNRGIAIKNRYPQSVDTRNNTSQKISSSKPSFVQSNKQTSRRTSTNKSVEYNTEKNERVPKGKDKEQESVWVWGMEPGAKQNSTDDDSLDNRAAFSGDSCPKNYVKVGEMCVKRQ